MKKNILRSFLALSFFLFSITYSKAQFTVNGTKTKNQFSFRGLFDKSDYDALKKSTVYYICRVDRKDKESLETLLSEAWTYSKIKVIYPSEFNDHATEEDAAFLSISMNYTVVEVEGVVLSLWRYKNPGENEIVVEYARINLLYDCQYQNIYKKDKRNPDPVFEYIYKKPESKNLMDCLLANYLIAIQESLEIQKKVERYDEVIKKEKLKKLKDETIYITENVVLKEFCETEKWDLKELMSKCPFKYKIISYEELYEKLLNKEPIVYILANRIEIQNRSLFLFDNRTKECLYSGLAGGRGGFWARDFELLGRLIFKE